MSDVFYLDMPGETLECHVITTLYSKVYDHHYLVYEMENSKEDEIFVSIYEPGDELKELCDVEGKELEDLLEILESNLGDDV